MWIVFLFKSVFVPKSIFVMNSYLFKFPIKLNNYVNKQIIKLQYPKIKNRLVKLKGGIPINEYD